MLITDWRLVLLLVVHRVFRSTQAVQLVEPSHQPQELVFKPLVSHLSWAASAQLCGLFLIGVWRSGGQRQVVVSTSSFGRSALAFRNRRADVLDPAQGSVPQCDQEPGQTDPGV